MQFDQTKAKHWLNGVSLSLPNLKKILKQSTTEILIIGAGVFDIYFEQGWIPSFKRKTGDLDISVGLVSGVDDYTVIRDALINAGYANLDPRYSFRFFSPKKISGALTYIDLLAHPMKAGISSELTKRVMGVGPDFSFSGINFARIEAYKIEDRILCPNPLAMIALKRAAYLDNPTIRVKDLADIVELAWGIVEKGLHFEMGPLWKTVCKIEEAKQVRATLYELGKGESQSWDLDDARQELLKRNFSGSEIDELLPARLIEWTNYLPLSG